MSKLLKLLGQEKYDVLKEFMGEAFAEFEAKFESDEITEDDVNSKLVEAGVEVEPSTSSENDETSGTETGGGSEEPVAAEKVEEAPSTEVVEQSEKTEGTVDVSNVLLDGWLEDGKCDTSKIVYAPLKEFIDGLLKIVEDSDWTARYKIAVMAEALKQGMHNIDDAIEFIGIESLSRDDDGNVIGVKEAFDKLRKNKPYLFKAVESAEDDILDKGFSPTDKKVAVKPRSYAEAVEATRNLLNN